MLAPRPPTEEETLAQARAYFTRSLPAIQGLASAQHSHLRGERKEEAVSETLALAWKSFRSLSLAGRDVVRLLPRIVEYAALRARSGFGITNCNPSQDVLSVRARFHNGHHVGSLSVSDREAVAREVLDGLSDDGSPADQAVLNVDFSRWLSGLDDTRREVAELLASGLNTVDVARLRGVSRGRIYQLRCDLIASWEEFTGEELR